VWSGRLKIIHSAASLQKCWAALQKTFRVQSESISLAKAFVFFSHFSIGVIMLLAFCSDVTLVVVLVDDTDVKHS